MNKDKLRTNTSFPVATEEEIDQASAKAEEFLKASHFYSDTRGTAKCAIMEYILFSQGKQMEST